MFSVELIPDYPVAHVTNSGCLPAAL